MFRFIERSSVSNASSALCEWADVVDDTPLFSSHESDTCIKKTKKRHLIGPNLGTFRSVQKQNIVRTGKNYDQ